jgi:3-hydroxyacyl-CoA dehydrogenase
VRWEGCDDGHRGLRPAIPLGPPHGLEAEAPAVFGPDALGAGTVSDWATTGRSIADPVAQRDQRFCANRLQSALLAETFRLVEGGIVNADEVDLTVSDGLGLRWFFMGPFKTIDLNAKSGIAEYCLNLGPMYHGLAKKQADPRPWSPALVEAIERQLHNLAPSMTISEQQAWRDRCLAKLTNLKIGGALAT